jgi:DNA (cytosine-5)-methyltransferase 1
MRNDEIIIDSFAGGGGASIGIEMALGRSPDVAINHDPEAVSMHKANHPDTEHHCQNVWQLDPQDVARGRKVGLAWFSPDCKHFSKAKGAAPVKRNVRDLAWVVVLYAQRVKPRVICLENVEEFKTWGPLDENGRPCAAQKGITFKKWINEFKKAGYKIQYRELRACDYGAPTSRKRLFVIARRDGQPIVWPKPTHGDPKAKGFKKSGLKPWRTAADIIDWSQPCPSIFMNSEEVQEWYEHTGQRLKRPLADATMRRIAQGLKRFVFDAEEPFIVTANHQGKGFRGQGLDEPMKTVTAARDATGLVTPYMTKFRKGSHGSPADAPMPTITASSFKKRPGGNPPLGLVVPYLTEHANGSKQRTFNAEEPMRTQCANV